MTQLVTPSWSSLKGHSHLVILLWSAVQSALQSAVGSRQQPIVLPIVPPIPLWVWLIYWLTDRRTDRRAMGRRQLISSMFDISLPTDRWATAVCHPLYMTQLVTPSLPSPIHDPVSYTQSVIHNPVSYTQSVVPYT